MELIQFVWLCCRTYRAAKKHGIAYAALMYQGVPVVCCFVGIGRDAWRVSQTAIIEFKERT